MALGDRRFQDGISPRGRRALRSKPSGVCRAATPGAEDALRRADGHRGSEAACPNRDLGTRTEPAERARGAWERKTGRYSRPRGAVPRLSAAAPCESCVRRDAEGRAGELQRRGKSNHHQRGAARCTAGCADPRNPARDPERRGLCQGQQPAILGGEADKRRRDPIEGLSGSA